jgi:cytochrome c peroxidase
MIRLASGAALAFALAAGAALAQIAGLPAGTEFGDRAPDRPRQVLRSEEQGGRQSFMVALGNTAFSSPLLFGPVARQAGLTCNTCHRQGDVNQAFYIPGLSSKPGNLDVTSPVFNPRADDRVANPVDIPSLRGVRSTGPYGHDGRTASLREFARNVIVGEFAGAEPAPIILDALVAYMNEFDFLPNPKLGPAGRLSISASAAAKRGEALFNKPFAGMGNQSCASCHLPSGALLDHRQHDVGSGGLFDTPTLLSANFTAPYFHDSRYDSYAEVVAHFDRVFALRLSQGEQADLVAYLNAIGDGDEPIEAATLRNEIRDIADYAGVIAAAIADRDAAIVQFVAQTVVIELGRTERRFPELSTAFSPSRRPDRRSKPADFPGLQALMRTIEERAVAGDFTAALTALEDYRKLAKTVFGSYPDADEATAR